MKNYPNLIHIHEYQMLRQCQVEINGKWVIARPLGFQSIWNRFGLAWMVFTGKADALIWDEQ